MSAPIFLAVFLGLVLARVACWAFVQTIWLPLTHRRGTVQASASAFNEPVREIPREQDEVSKAEQWLRWAALNIPAASDPRYFKATVRLSVTAVEYRRSFGEALDRHFDDPDIDTKRLSVAAVEYRRSIGEELNRHFDDANVDEAPAPEARGAIDGEIETALDRSTRRVLYEYEVTLYDDEAARRNRLSAAIGAGVDALRQRRVISRSHRAALEEYASGTWRPAKDDPGPALVTAMRALITEVDAIQGQSEQQHGLHAKGN